MPGSQSTRLDERQQAAYRERGYHWPLRGFEPGEVARQRAGFDAYWEETADLRVGKLPRDWRAFLTETHLFLRWVYDIVSSPRVLDAVESVLGPDIIVWNTHWFPKPAHDKAYISWHQDATYWGLSPPHVTTAWVALTESTELNGCLKVVPGTHKTMLPQRETFAEANMLSRGQEIAVDVDEAAAVALALRPGEFSLHDIGIIHGSGPNQSDAPRIGVAVRYISPDVIQKHAARDIAILVRGQDRFGHFDLVAPPTRDERYGESAVHAEALARKVSNLSR
ncbi:MAG: phytanoyl-CoA dioxygenase family protein [Steroidobacteraceae bacterium]